MQEPPRVRSATSFSPIAGFPSTGLLILRGSAGTGGDLIAARELNFKVSRVGQPGYRTHGWAEAAPSMAIGARRGCCAEISKMPPGIVARTSKRPVALATLTVRTRSRFIDMSFVRLILSETPGEPGGFLRSHEAVPARGDA